MSETIPTQETPRRIRSKAVFILPLVLVVGLVGLMYIGLRSGGGSSNIPSVLIGKTVPEFNLAAIPHLQNEAGAPVSSFSSATLKNGKVSLLNFWASWCAPCLAEHPQLVDLAKAGVTLYGIDYKGDTSEAARRFLTRHGNPFLAVGADETGMTGIDLGVTGVPETFVVDGSGRIVMRYQGPLTPEAVAEKIKPAIEKADKESSPSRS